VASDVATLTVPNRIEFIRPATLFLVQAARALDVPMAAAPVFEVAISEAMTNAFRHGSDKSNEATITCQLDLADRTLKVRIIYDDEAFLLPTGALPQISREHIDAVPASGYGLPIIRTVFPDVRVVEIAGRFGVELTLSY
jgi:anti-sigma regulatory factor (Ser/Thr protein kinase)